MFTYIIDIEMFQTSESNVIISSRTVWGDFNDNLLYFCRKL